MTVEPKFKYDVHKLRLGLGDTTTLIADQIFMSIMIQNGEIYYKTAGEKGTSAVNSHL